MVTPKLITLENEIPVFNPEARLIKQFKAIIERDRGSEGDSQGRKKLMATRELAFVSLYEDLTSAYNRNYEEGPERINELKRGLELPANWKLDDVMKEAMTEYRKHLITPSSAMLVSVRSALYSARNIINILDKRLKSVVDELYTADILDDDSTTNLIEKATKLVQLILDQAAKITKYLDDIDALEKKYIKEIEETKGKNRTTVNQHQL